MPRVRFFTDGMTPPSGPCNATLLGTALILKAAGTARTLAEGVDAANHALDSGAGVEMLGRLRELCK